MALTDVSLIEFSAIPALDPLAPIGPAWLLLVQDNVTNAVWRATTAQAKAAIAPAVVVSAASAPVVSLALSTSAGQLGALITLSATATSGSSTIAKVDFFDSGVKVGTATAQPYQTTYTPALSGRHSIVAVATDANGTASTSPPQNLDIAALAIVPIIVALVPMAPGTVGTALSLVATASLAGGTIAKVEFFDGANKVGESASAPYGCSYVPTTAGPHYFTAKATSSTGASAISAALTVFVVTAVTITNQPPACSLSASNSSIVLGQSVTLSALASDVDGAVIKVEFFDGATVISLQTSAPYSFSYTPTTAGGHALSAKATDNLGAFTTAALNITVNSAAIYPAQPTNVTGVVLPLSALVPTTSVGLSWLAPAANGGLPATSYYVFRSDGTSPIGQVATLSFIDTYVVAGFSYTYTVSALSQTGQGNQSLASQKVSIPLVTAPVVVTPPVVVVGSFNTTLTGPSASPASGLPGAGITLTSLQADLLKFNNITGGDSTPKRMNVTVGGLIVAAVDFPAAYVGTGFSLTLVGQAVRTGNFTDGSVSF